MNFDSLALAFPVVVKYIRVFKENKYSCSVEYVAWTPLEAHIWAGYFLDGEIEHNGTRSIDGNAHIGYTNGGSTVWIPMD